MKQAFESSFLGVLFSQLHSTRKRGGSNAFLLFFEILILLSEI